MNFSLFKINLFSCSPLLYSFVLIVLLSQNCFAESEFSLSDLGFDKSETKSDPLLQNQLDRRESMLQTHQKLGFLTAGLMATTFLLRNSKPSTHRAFGLATSASYFTTSYFSLTAPRGLEKKESGNSLWHKRLRYFHFVGMVATPVLGWIRYNKIKAGKEVKGIAKAHDVVAIATMATFYSALLVLTF